MVNCDTAAWTMPCHIPDNPPSPLYVSLRCSKLMTSIISCNSLFLYALRNIIASPRHIAPFILNAAQYRSKQKISLAVARNHYFPGKSIPSKGHFYARTFKNCVKLSVLTHLLVTILRCSFYSGACFSLHKLTARDIDHFDFCRILNDPCHRHDWKKIHFSVLEQLMSSKHRITVPPFYPRLHNFVATIIKDPFIRFFHIFISLAHWIMLFILQIVIQLSLVSPSHTFLEALQNR